MSKFTIEDGEVLFTERLTLEEFRKLFCTSGIWEKTHEGSGNVRIYRGSVLRVNIYGIESGLLQSTVIPPSFRNADEFDTGYSTLWYSDEERATINYCEGDITVAVAENQAAYEAELRHVVMFYTKDGKTHYGPGDLMDRFPSLTVSK